MNTIDARGHSCPEPVLMTKKAFATNEKNYTILVDSPAAKENVIRFANQCGFSVSITQNGDDYTLTVSK